MILMLLVRLYNETIVTDMQEVVMELSVIINLSYL